MAKTTSGKPKKQTTNTGPVLVDDPENPGEAIPAPDPEEELEEIDPAEAQPAPQAADPRRIPESSMLEPRAFAAFVAQYPAPADLDAYFYRLFPVVKNLAPPEWPPNKKFPTYIEKVKGLLTPQTNQVFTWDWLRDIRGSGKYNIKLIDRTLKRTQNRMVCETNVEVNEWDTHPPVLNDWAELVPCDANKWIIERLLREKIIKRTPEGGFVAFEISQNGTAPAAPNGADPVSLMRETLNAAERMAKMMAPPKEDKKDESPFQKIDIVKLIEGSQNANDPGKILTAAKELAAMMKPPEQPKADPEAHLKMVLEIAKLFKPADVAPQPSALDQLKQTAELAKVMRESFGPTETEIQAKSHMNGWQEFLKEPLTEFVGLLKPFAQLGAGLLMQRATQGNAPSPAAPRPTPPATTQLPTAVPNPAPANGAAPPTPAAATGEPGQPAADQPQQPQQAAPMDQQQVQMQFVIQVLNQVTPTLISYLENPEMGGKDLALWFIDTSFNTNLGMMKGLALWEMLRPMMEREQLLQLYQTSPYWKNIQPYAEKFPKFVDEFLAYDPEKDAEHD